MKNYYPSAARLSAAVLTGAAGIAAGCTGHAFGWYIFGACVPLFLIGAVICFVLYRKEKKIAAEREAAEEEARLLAVQEMQGRRVDAEFMEIFEKKNKHD